MARKSERDPQRPCPVCGGLGVKLVFVPDPTSAFPGERGKYIELPCGRCGGTGYV